MSPATQSPAPGSDPGAPSEIIVRALRSPTDFRACVELQRHTWGADFNDLVPAHLIKVSQRIGGVAAGAFDEGGTMLGFVFGMTGIRDGEAVHWSDMLAVRSETRGRGIGRMLKEHQREEMRKMGVGTIQWSFDPLVARNAHLNLVRLGATVDEYVVDMYADSNSPLHQGLGTDRFVASWRTDPGGNQRGRSDHRETVVVNSTGDGELMLTPTLPEAVGEIRIEVPADIHRVQANDAGMARLWRESSRAAFLEAFARGYAVAGFARDRETGRCYYILDAKESHR